ncbi:uncharacterized protein ASPGLDRAFT_224748 [Aspergillus glaucus CBS 516.65]|uniref:Uncharacterized protein n=1 Tax=Aspergillus glaucus CBS 516.65 TaxID=1160497 RepID=A0A1L9VZI0_ASPGL|nr:hypothetical protein ASPGLDRAFT_224748 [Aspergillus glaucus CBS 516.65]OJJ89289.1 hypothetical protein ASPGLDRAFT_224748 [Aspergillus glaucus CBS 516.65]
MAPVGVRSISLINAMGWGWERRKHSKKPYERCRASPANRVFDRASRQLYITTYAGDLHYWYYVATQIRTTVRLPRLSVSMPRNYTTDTCTCTFLVTRKKEKKRKKDKKRKKKEKKKKINS